MKEQILNDNFEVLRTGMSDNANLMSDNELGELFGGYCENIYCGRGYEADKCKCKRDFCDRHYQ